MHFRSGIGGDSKISETAYEIIHDLDDLNNTVRERSNELEKSLAQLEDYQLQMQALRHKIIQEEQQLRLVLAPTYLPHDREKAVTEQQVRLVFLFCNLLSASRLQSIRKSAIPFFLNNINYDSRDSISSFSEIIS